MKICGIHTVTFNMQCQASNGLNKFEFGIIDFNIQSSRESITVG